MAKTKNTGATPTPTAAGDAQTGAGTNGGDNGEQTTKNKGGRRPGSGEDALYFNGDRDLALTVLVASNPGQLTSKQIAAALASHPAFADQRALIETGTKHESFRQRLIKLNKRWVEKGRPSLELRRLANTNYDVDAVLDKAAAQVYGGGVQAQDQAQAQGQVAPMPVAAGGFTGGLIPTA